MPTRTDNAPSNSITIALGVWLAILLVIAGSRFVAGWGWLIDLLANVSHFVVAPALLTAAIVLWRRRWFAASIAGLALIVGGWPVAPTVVPNFTRGDDEDSITLLVCNVKGTHEAVQGLIAIMQRERPDLVVVIAAGAPYATRIVNDPDVAEMYPFREGPQRAAQWQRVVLSRWPMHHLRFDGDFERYKFLYAYRRAFFVDSPGGRFILTGAHPASPRTAETWKQGNASMVLLSEVIREHMRPTGVPIIIGGDFNSTLSGYRHRYIRRETGMHSCDAAGPPVGTWPAHWPGLLRLSIDRVWASREVRFLSRRVLDDIGSDHRPILVRWRLPGG